MNNITTLFIVIAYIMEFVPYMVYMFLLPRVLHIMQLEGYKFNDYTRWVGKNTRSTFAPGFFQLLVNGCFILFIAAVNFIVYKINPNYLTNALFWVEYFCVWAVFLAVNLKQVFIDRKARKNAKKKLVYTARLKRLIVWNFILLPLMVVTYIGSNEIFMYLSPSLYHIAQLLFFSVMILLMPLNIVIANFLAYPTEALIHDKYIEKARRKLNKKKYKDLIKIGITGSYGKTSTKCILKTILSEKYNVYATPESFNTTMGNVRAILEELEPEHEVFISEMGARRKGDIAEICRFVKPQYGMITSIGPQHLETFGTIEKVIKTKSELINALPNDGIVFLPRDDERCQELYDNEKREKYTYTIKNKKADVYTYDLVVGNNGSSFTAKTSIGDIKCQTVLLGEHNVLNILGCIAIAVKMGLTVEQIEAGVKKIEPITHRLEILDSGNGTIVIDDAFNSNPVGAKMALDVLSKFKGRKIIVTPGMVELGTREEIENKTFGKNMAKVVDIAILVGLKRSKPIAEGLKEGKFDDMNVYVVPSLEAASAKLAEITKQGDVILFENDLPDTYNE